MTFTDALKLQMRLATLMVEAQSVMALRVLGMTGVIPADPRENGRMISEKGPAMARACLAANRAALAGKRPDQIMSAALVPLGAKVRANRKRLTR